MKITRQQLISAFQAAQECTDGEIFKEKTGVEELEKIHVDDKIFIFYLDGKVAKKLLLIARKRQAMEKVVQIEDMSHLVKFLHDE